MNHEDFINALKKGMEALLESIEQPMKKEIEKIEHSDIKEILKEFSESANKVKEVISNRLEELTSKEKDVFVSVADYVCLTIKHLTDPIIEEGVLNQLKEEE